MSAGRPWIKLDREFDSHPKVHKLTNGEKYEYILLIQYCARHMTDGAFPEGVITKRTLDKLIARSLVVEAQGTLRVSNYLEWQTPRAKIEKERETQRNKKKWQRCPPGTPAGVPGGVPLVVRSLEVEIEIEEEIREGEHEREPVATAPATHVGEGKPKRGQRAKPKTGCPESTAPNATAFATLWGLDPAHGEYSRFLDHHVSKGSLFANWAAAWRTWQSNAERWGKSSGVHAVVDVAKSARYAAWEEKMDADSRAYREEMKSAGGNR